MPEGSADLFPVFFSVWILLGLFSAGFFFLNKNAAFKRKVWPPFVVLTGVLFVAFALALRIPGQALVVMVPAVVLITFFNLRTVQFCDGCGWNGSATGPGAGLRSLP